MQDTTQGLARLGWLRQKATARLKGQATAPNAHTQAASALSVLMSWAASSDTAADALTLLHELQVHQVELDLQAEELRDARSELEAELSRQTERFDRQPVACFTLNASLQIQDLNLAAAALLGMPQSEAPGLGVDEFCAPESAADLRGRVCRSLAGESLAPARIELGPKGTTSKVFWGRLGVDSAASQCFLVLTSEP